MTKVKITEPEAQVYERGGETRVRYRIRYKDLNGKWVSKYSADLESAEERYAEIKQALEMGVELGKCIKFKDCASEALKQRRLLIGKKNGLRRQTWDNDERHLRLHLTPYFGEMQVKSITTGLINEYMEEMTVKEIASKTQRHILSTLNMVMKFAVRRGYISTNPNAKGDREVIRGSMGKRGGYLEDEVQALLAQNMTQQVRAMIMTLAYTGIAANELQGLQWKDIDLYQGLLTVQRTGYRGGVQDETKTEYRNRALPLPSALVTVLREWQLACRSPVFAFPSVTGRMGEQNAWRKLVATVCRHAGVEDKGLGGFRKYYNTQMELSGVPKSIRNYRMGHSSKSNTADIHYTEQDIKLAQNAGDIEKIAARHAS